MVSKLVRSYQLTGIAIFGILASAVVIAQEADQARQGPYERLAIVNAMVIPGHGGPAYGPADIIVENNKIVQIIGHNGVTGRATNAATPDADRVIDATGNSVDLEAETTALVADNLMFQALVNGYNYKVGVLRSAIGSS